MTAPRAASVWTREPPTDCGVLVECEFIEGLDADGTGFINTDKRVVVILDHIPSAAGETINWRWPGGAWEEPMFITRTPKTFGGWVHFEFKADCGDVVMNRARRISPPPAPDVEE